LVPRRPWGLIGGAQGGAFGHEMQRAGITECLQKQNRPQYQSTWLRRHTRPPVVQLIAAEASLKERKVHDSLPVRVCSGQDGIGHGLLLMTTLHGIARYCLVGGVNTGFHALIFLICHSLWGMTQTSSNLAGFLAAVSLSFFLNARFTFDSYRSWRRYWLYCAFMGIVSLGIGALGDRLSWAPLVTLVVFSAVSLVLGYTFARHVVFKERAP
jgi:putative flippase GtrA